MKTKSGTRLPGALAFATAICLTAASCGDTDCLDNRSSLPLAGLYDSEGAQVSVGMLTVYGIDAPGDSMLYASATLSQAYLPFRLDCDTTRYVFKYMAFASPGGDGDSEPPAGDDTGEPAPSVPEEIPDASIPRDTLTFIYERRPWFSGVACGAMYNFVMKEVRTTHFAIDTVVNTVDVIDNINIESFRIYFKVDGEDDGDGGI